MHSLLDPFHSSSTAFCTASVFASTAFCIRPHIAPSRGRCRSCLAGSAFLGRPSGRKRAHPVRPDRRSVLHPGNRRVYMLRTHGDSGDFNESSDHEQDEWVLALEDLMIEALRAYYEGTPFFTDAEFNTLRDELQHLGIAQLRLPEFESLWVQATSSRDLDRRIRNEFNLSEDDLTSLKSRLRAAGGILHPTIAKPRSHRNGSASNSSTSSDSTPTKPNHPKLPPTASIDSQYTGNAQKIDCDGSVNERVKWYVLQFALRSEVFHSF